MLLVFLLICKVSTRPDVHGYVFERGPKSVLIQLLLKLRVKVFLLVCSLKELIHYLTLVHFLLDHRLGLL